MTAVEKLPETAYWSSKRINARIDSYVLGVQSRMNNETMGKNPFKVEESPEQWKEWRQGWMDGRGFEHGKLTSILINEK